MVIHDYLTTVSCDKCSNEFQVEKNWGERAMRKAASKRGWRVVDGGDICPECVKKMDSLALCSEIECAPPYGDKKDCELNKDGFCGARMDGESNE